MLKFDINLLFTVINLFILFFIIWKFLFKPVKKIIAKRQEEVEKQYKDAEDAVAEANATKADYQEQMAGIESEKASILKEVRLQAGTEYDRIISDAKRDSASIIANAIKVADETKQQTMKQTRDEIADIVSEAAAKLSATKEDPEADRRLFDDFLAKTGDELNN